MNKVTITPLKFAYLVNNVIEERDNLQQRIDKAIKYILDCTEYDLFDSTLEECDKDFLLNILKGSDKE